MDAALAVIQFIAIAMAVFALAFTITNLGIRAMARRHNKQEDTYDHMMRSLQEELKRQEELVNSWAGVTERLPLTPLNTVNELRRREDLDPWPGPQFNLRSGEELLSYACLVDGKIEVRTPEPSPPGQYALADVRPRSYVPQGTKVVSYAVKTETGQVDVRHYE